ncbi:MAG: redoxin domain-containing protein [Pseudobdellovibrionaceae bacterium]|nr:redoxin domain-containing protein [Bdellovibrionales bacterium]USN46088.1 MAG: redoxin domain-containing protein [Pseudobdellovibrionaceae bacterium]
MIQKIAIRLLFLGAAFAISILAFAETPPAEISGRDLVTGKDFHFDIKQKPTALVFLSARCPCSNSHIEHINKLAKQHPSVQFVGVHSNQNESVSESHAYFSKYHLSFPVIHDNDAALANAVGALKTPHVFVYDTTLTLRYRGGVTSSSQMEKAKKLHLSDFLSEFERGSATLLTEVRSLGCYIKRK